MSARGDNWDNFKESLNITKEEDEILEKFWQSSQEIYVEGIILTPPTVSTDIFWEKLRTFISDQGWLLDMDYQEPDGTEGIMRCVNVDKIKQFKEEQK